MLRAARIDTASLRAKRSMRHSERRYRSTRPIREVFHRSNRHAADTCDAHTIVRTCNNGSFGRKRPCTSSARRTELRSSARGLSIFLEPSKRSPGYTTERSWDCSCSCASRRSSRSDIARNFNHALPAARSRQHHTLNEQLSTRQKLRAKRQHRSRRDRNHLNHRSLPPSNRRDRDRRVRD